MFQINKVFHLTNRGEVIVGTILNGEIEPGNFIQVKLNGSLTLLKIKSVESIIETAGSSETGLLMETLDKDSINFNDVVGQTVAIINS